MFIMNVGMQIGDGPEHLNFDQIRDALRARRIEVERAHVHVPAEGEPCMVISSPGKLSRFAVCSLARRLGQDCIAVWNSLSEEGELIGPNAAAWGEFDPEQFILPSGVSLAHMQRLIAGARAIKRDSLLESGG
jgi:hypothetical protein